MRWWLAIPFSLLIVFLAGLLSASIGNWFMWAFILGTALWAAYDSGKIKLHQYKSAMPYKPITVFLVIAGLWLIAFPWYLSLRYRIKSGKAVLRDDPDAHKGILSRGI